MKAVLAILTLMVVPAGAIHLRGRHHNAAKIWRYEDQDMWGAGASFTYMGFTLGGSYRWTDQGTSGPNSDRWDANIGLVYAWGPWSVGAAYGHGEVEVGPGAGEDEMDQVEIGFTYNLGPGVDIAGGVQFVDFDSDTGGPAAKNDAVIGLLGTVITF